MVTFGSLYRREGTHGGDDHQVIPWGSKRR